MRRYTCCGCSCPEVGKPAGVVSEGPYEGPQCENCWAVHLDEAAAEEREWAVLEAAEAASAGTKSAS